MRFVFILILTVATRSGFSQTSVIDKINHSLENHPQEDTVRVSLLNELSYHFRWIDFAASQHYAQQALELAKRLDFAKGIATADNRIAHCYWALGDNEFAIERALEANALAEHHQLQAIVGESFLILSRSYMDQREFPKAMSYIQKSEKIAHQIKNWDLLSRVYNLAGVLAFVQNNPSCALPMYNRALAILREQPISKAHLSQITSNIGECYVDSNPDSSLIYFREALSISRAEETRNKSAEASILGAIGRASIEKRDYPEAERYLQQSLRLSREMGLRRTIRHAYAGLVNLKIREGHATEALAYLKKYYNVHDSLLNATKTRQIVELENKHEMEKKELAIQLLERDNKIHMLWTNLLITVLSLTIVISMAIVYLLVYRENNNRKILNLQIDNLTTQHKELSEKYKDALTGGNPVSVESADQRLLKKAIEIVENNISDPLFGVEQMAREMGMSRTNMHRKIKAFTGFPPSELIRNIRLRKAASLLLNQADSISQIGFRVGFEDNSYFSKVFKKQFGVTPSDYLQSMKQPDQLARLEIEI